MATPFATPATSESSTLYFGPWYRRSPFFEKTLEAGAAPTTTIGLVGPGTPLEVEAPDGSRWQARTAAIPFLDAKKDVPKS